MHLEQMQTLNENFINKIGCYKPISGDSTQIDQRLVKALRKHLRHEFIERFCLFQAPSNFFDVSDEGALAKIYSNQPLLYVGADNRMYNASSSEPAFILHLLTLLNIQPGERVLEIGCGTGWLLSLIGELVGETGQVTGVEILPELADIAQSVISRKAMENVAILKSDANRLPWEGQFDKVIFTTSSYFFPAFLWHCVKENGKVLIPIRNKGLAEEAHLLERQDDRFYSLTARFCKFVEMSGAVNFLDERDPSGLRDLPESPAFQKLLNQKNLSQEFYFDQVKDPENHFHLPFSAFMSKTEPDFFAYRLKQSQSETSGAGNGIYGDLHSIGLSVNRSDNNSLAIWRNHHLNGYGDRQAFETFACKFEEWRQLGCPSGVAFKLSVSQDKPSSSIGQSEYAWLELRGRDYFAWSL